MKMNVLDNISRRKHQLRASDANMFLGGTSVDTLDIIFRVGITSNISTLHFMETPDQYFIKD